LFSHVDAVGHEEIIVAAPPFPSTSSTGQRFLLHSSFYTDEESTWLERHFLLPHRR
jgi:hypothetical protein